MEKYKNRGNKGKFVFVQFCELKTRMIENQNRKGGWGSYRKHPQGATEPLKQI